MKSFIRRMILEIINWFLNHDWFFQYLGRKNKKKDFIKSIFLAYPEEYRYGLYYAFPGRLKRNKWIPFLSGYLRQNGKITLMFTISANDEDFQRPVNKEKLSFLYKRMWKISKMLNIESCTFAGILPGVFFMSRIARNVPEADVTAQVVTKSLEDFMEKNNMPIVILGGKGFIGKRVNKLFSKVINSEVFNVDKNDLWPDFQNNPILVLNVSRKYAIEEYLNQIPSKSIILNEVYPPPDEEVLNQFRNKEIEVFHIVGVEGKAIPDLPFGYAGGIPCCAAWPANGIQPVIRKI